MADNSFIGNKVLVFGDLHFSSTFTGKHKNYTEECYYNMIKIRQIVEKEKPSAVFFAGDINGVNEQNVSDRQFLMRELQWLDHINKLTKGHVYSVKGNHDFGTFSDFDFLVGLGYIKNPKHVDMYYKDLSTGENILQTRFHLVNYGHETDKLAPLAKSKIPDACDIVLGHADYYIDGVSEYYSARSGVELSSLNNFLGVDLVFSGHIHIPSRDLLMATMGDGSQVGLFYMGSPSRVADRYDDCWYICFESIDKDTINYEPKLMGLQKADEIFYPEEDYVMEEPEDDEISKEQSDKLTELVKSIIESRIATGDIEAQINAVPGVSDEVKSVAIKYYRMSIEQGSVG